MKTFPCSRCGWFFEGIKKPFEPRGAKFCREAIGPGTVILRCHKCGHLAVQARNRIRELSKAECAAIVAHPLHPEWREFMERQFVEIGMWG